MLALWAPNQPQWAGVALAALAAGGTVTGVNPDCTERELVGQLSDAGASVLVTIPSLVPAAWPAATAAGVGEVIVLGDAEPGSATPVAALLDQGGPAARAVAHPDAGPGSATPVAARAVAGHDPDADSTVALLPYSSGTTGLPKGVMLTHTNLVSSVRQVGSGLRLTERDTTIAVAPFFHTRHHHRGGAVLPRHGASWCPSPCRWPPVRRS